ncbi:MAG: alpha-amylase, partial [Promethearchaeota archaeon]
YGPDNENFIKMLQTPFKLYPHSIHEQLEYLYKNWSELLDEFNYKILLALDLIREEELFRGLGPGKSRVHEYDMEGIENFTPDRDWMPKVVMLAKNVYVWLDQLSKKYQKPISKLHEIPDEELNTISGYGFNALWLIGIWERSEASKKIKRWCGNPEAEASAYSLYDYTIANDLGGEGSFQNLKERALKRGIRLASDMVPNHTGIVSKWTIEHPDWFISLPYPPFPSYQYSGESLSSNSHIGIYLEDKYFNRSDAAVTFKHIDFKNNQTRYVYHGNDGTSFPWNDTAQLNYLIPEVREAVIQNILRVSRLFPIIRFDAAMTLTKKHYQRLWFPEPGTGGAIPSRSEHGISKAEFNKAMPKEFWREVVDRINKENSDTLLLAEAFWLLEGFFVRTLGMHRVYNSAFMNMLRDEENSMYRLVVKNTLEFDPEILKRFVNFMNNPDEETAIKQFGTGDKYFGICLMMVTMPGLPMFGHGQLEGYHEKYGMEYRRAYWDENIDVGLLKHHEKIIFPMLKKRYLFAEVTNFILYDFWTGNVVDEDVFAYSNLLNNERTLVIYHNKFKETKGFIKNSVGFAVKKEEDKEIKQKTLSEGLNLPLNGYCIFKDHVKGLEYIRRNKDIHDKGLYIELQAYQIFIFHDFRIVQDNQFFHYAQLFDFLRGKGVLNMDDALSDVIYQPIHSPFKKLIDVDKINELLDDQTREQAINRFSSIMDSLLKQVENYMKGTGNTKKIRNLLIKKINIGLNYKQYLINFKEDPDLIRFINEIIPKTPLEWSIIISWVILHQLGRLKSEESYELRSRSLIDEWHLSKFLSNTFKEISTENDTISLQNAIQLVKIMTSQQNWYDSLKLSDLNARITLEKIFQDIEVQQYLYFNRYKEVLWFNKESFMELIRWLVLIASSNILDINLSSLKENLKLIAKIYEIWKNAAKKANYKVNEALNLLKEGTL